MKRMKRSTHGLMAPPAALPRGCVRGDKAGLALVRRCNGRTEWLFTKRASNAPPLAATAPSLCEAREHALVNQADPEKYWWWITDASLACIGEQLRSRCFLVLDGILGRSASVELRKEVIEARDLGKLTTSKLAGGRDGSKLTYTHTAVRGDLIGWFDGDEPALWTGGAFNRYLQKIDTLVAQLAEHVSELSGISTRSKAMVTCYPGNGSRYVRHCDNSCDTGRGERCNGRRITAIIYLNPDWQHADGGELRLYEPYAPKGRPPLADVQPIMDR